MDNVKNVHFWMLFCLCIVATANAQADTVIYTLDNVMLSATEQMTGTFSWTYDVGDFENGTGQFTFLDIPWTAHNHTDLNATFDIGKSIEITLEGSVHDDGVDITLVLEQPLTPTTSSLLSLGVILGVEQSKYEIGGNGFHTGLVLSGSISPVLVPDVPPCWLCPTQCHGDVEGCDADVDTIDWPIFRDAFGSTYPGPNYHPCADLDQDGDVDTIDWPEFRDNFGSSTLPMDCPVAGTWPPGP